jgi:hypothetical protein
VPAAASCSECIRMVTNEPKVIVATQDSSSADTCGLTIITLLGDLCKGAYGEEGQAEDMQWCWRRPCRNQLSEFRLHPAPATELQERCRRRLMAPSTARPAELVGCETGPDLRLPAPGRQRGPTLTRNRQWTWQEDLQTLGLSLVDTRCHHSAHKRDQRDRKCMQPHLPISINMFHHALAYLQIREACHSS